MTVVINKAVDSFTKFSNPVMAGQGTAALNMSVCTNWGEFIKSWVTSGRAEQPHLILQIKLDYVPNICCKHDVRQNYRLGSREALT